MEDNRPQTDDEINLLDYLIVILKRKKMILAVTLACAMVAAIIGLIMPPVFRAETRILPPQTSGSSLAMGMLSQMAGADIAATAVGIKTPSDLYVDMIKGRSVADRIIDRFGLMNLYDAKYREDARKDLLEDAMTALANKKSGIITIAVQDKDPKRAADMANAFVEELKNLTKGLAIGEAAQRRLFFEEQLKDTRSALVRSEDTMKGFMEKTGALQIEEQAKSLIESIANLRAQLAAQEVELRVMKTYATPSNPDLQKAEEALQGMKAELGKLEGKTSSGHDPLLPTGRMPEVGTEYFRKLRDLKFNEKLYELLLKQYEAARLDEAKEAAIIQVVDEAIPPDKRVKPKRTSIVLIATVGGFFLSVFAAFFMEFLNRSSVDPENKSRLEKIRSFMSLRR